MGGGLFLSALLIISLCVVLYNRFYIKSSYALNYYIGLLFCFFVSIVILLLRKTRVILFYAWEGLGVTSALLVGFFINNESTSGLIWTNLTNRLGDSFLILSLLLTTLWGLNNLNITEYWFFLFIARNTKRAQAPFMVWLTKAISAPTPISALVHSSTLVVAGVVLLSLKKNIIKTRRSNLAINLALVRLLISSVLAQNEKDLKKTVALRTLSQVSLCLFLLARGRVFLFLNHITAHAFYKSLLFLIVGGFIYQTWGEQELRNQEGGNKRRELLPLWVVLRALTGLFFTSGIVRKENFLRITSEKGTNNLKILIFLIGLSLTLSYAFRLVKLNNLLNTPFLGPGFVRFNYKKRQVPLYIFTLTGLAFFNRNFNEAPLGRARESFLIWVLLLSLFSWRAIKFQEQKTFFSIFETGRFKKRFLLENIFLEKLLNKIILTTLESLHKFSIKRSWRILYLTHIIRLLLVVLFIL